MLIATLEQATRRELFHTIHRAEDKAKKKLSLGLDVAGETCIIGDGLGVSQNVGATRGFTVGLK